MNILYDRVHVGVGNRVEIVTRRWQETKDRTAHTNDVLVDGKCYTPAVSDQWLEENLPKIIDIVASKTLNHRHHGMGQWKTEPVVNANQVVVCAWCWPKMNELEEAFPQFIAFEKTHGICEPCKWALLAKEAS